MDMSHEAFYLRTCDLIKKELYSSRSDMRRKRFRIFLDVEERVVLAGVCRSFTCEDTARSLALSRILTLGYAKVHAPLCALWDHSFLWSCGPERSLRSYLSRSSSAWDCYHSWWDRDMIDMIPVAQHGCVTLLIVWSKGVCDQLHSADAVHSLCAEKRTVMMYIPSNSKEWLLKDWRFFERTDEQKDS